MKKTLRSHARKARNRSQFFQSSAMRFNGMRLRDIPFALALAFGAVSSHAEPTGGAVAAGQAAISAINGVTTVQQMSDRAIVNWQSFNVNAGEAVKFVQPGRHAAILNRVTGGSVSNIDGLLQGNGRVYLINPNGIVVGANGVVNVNGGFVASTKGIADSAFMSGGALVFTGESTGSIQILGKVQSAQGDVILIAPKVAIEKTAELIAGQSIKLVAASEVELSNGKLTVKPKAEDAGQITVEGALTAAKVQLTANNNNLGALAINTNGNIRATGTQRNADGSVSIVATGEGGNINISGQIRSEKGDGHGGAVTVLADNGIRINGTINANSTDTSKVGGDIYIGRDVTTNKLARATDVSGATLLSNKGFVETSGDWLKTNNITVLAKDWLLDPTDIRIVASDTGTTNTASSNVGGVSGTTTFQDSTAITASEVLKSTIESAINAGTSVTISTANSTVGANGSGNITIATALSFNNTGAQDATFRLFAVNGITQNAGSTITAIGTKNVNIEMLALGRHMGVDANSTSSQGIVLNNIITTNGSVIIDGSNRNTNGNSIGVRFNNNSGITAASYNVKGSAISLQTGSYGVGMFDTVKFKSTGDSVINGTSLAQSTALTFGTMIYDNANVSFDAGNTGGKLVVKGSNATFETGLRISGFASNTKVTTDGDVTLGALEDKSNFSFRAGTITANSGKLTILGQLVGGGSAVNSFDGASITANNGVSVEIKGVAKGTGNAVRLGENTPLAIKALQGTAANAGNINVTGESNSGAAVWITAGSSLEAANVTLKGTSTTGTAINGTGKLTATNGNVIIDGLSGNGSSYATITNAPINATGDITIKGTGSAKHGVFLGSNVTGNNITSTGGKIIIEGDTTGTGGVSGSGSGTAVTGNAIIIADKDITVTGKTNGFYSINGLGNITSNNGNVMIDGYSRDSRGVSYANTITAEKGNIKVIGGSGIDGTVTSTAASAGNEHGVYFSGLAKAKNVTIEGSSISSVGTFIGSVSGTNIDATETVTILGKSTGNVGINLGSPNGFGAFNATIKSAGDTNVNGKGVTGVRVWAGSSIDAKNINVLGTAVTRNTTETGFGVDFERIVATANFKSTEDINIEGTLTGAGIGSGIKTTWRNQNGNSPTMNAGGNFTLRGNNRAIATNTNAAINADSGMQVKAGKNIVVQAETNNMAARAMTFFSTTDNYRGNTSFVSSGGDILIQANQGAIVFNNLQTSATGQLTDITGRNITIDNTGAGMATGAGNLVGAGGTKGGVVGSGSIDTATGTVVAGTGKATAAGVNFADIRKIEASGNLNIMGASTSNWGVVNYNGLTGTTLKGGAVNIQGTSETGGGIYTAGNIESTVGAVSMIGRSTSASGVSGITLQAQVKGKANVTLEGYSANTNNIQGLVIQDAVTSETGTITVIGETKAASQRAVAITQNGSKFGSLNTTNKDITIIGNTLLIAPGTPGATVNAGTGTVFIKTLTAGNEIVLGAEDSMSTSLNSQKLGIDNTELARITSGKLVIGENAAAVNNGKITVGVSSEIFTASSNGNVVLQTQGDISINHKFTIASGKSLTLNSGGNVTDDNSNGIIKTDKLELLGTNGAFVLDNTNHAVGTLAANVKSLEFTNGSQLIVGNVNGTTGVTAKDGVSVTTQLGDLILNETIINNTSGNVVVGAGISKAAGDGTGGDVKTAIGKAITTQTGGKLYVYTGSAAGTGLLQNLTGGNNTAFSTLSLSDYTADDLTTVKQNAAANVAYKTGSSLSVISPDTAAAQVLFREKVAIDTADLNGFALNLTYGDIVGGIDITHSGQTANLYAAIQTGLKQANLGTTVASSTLTNLSSSGANTFRISKAVVLGDMTGALESPVTLSTSNHLTAKTHDYGELTGTNYTTTLAAGKAQVIVAKKTITLSGITADSREYDGTREATVNKSSATFNGMLAGDHLSIDNSTTGTFDTKNAGNEKVVALTNTFGGDDLGNYNITNQDSTKANITKNTTANVVLTGNTDLTKVYNGAQQSVDGLSATGLLGDDVANKGGASAVTAGKNAGTYTNTLFSNLSELQSNYANVETINGELKIGQNTTANVVLTANSLKTTFNGSQQSVTGLLKADGLVGADAVDNIGVIAVTSGIAVGVYTDTQFTNLGQLQNNYANVSTINGTLTIDYGGVIPPTPPVRYVPLASDSVNLSPVTFAMGVVPATASGDEADPNICYAWSQRDGGNVVVHTVLKPTYLGLRTAKTDTQDASSNASGAISHVDSQCGSNGLAKIASSSSYPN